MDRAVSPRSSLWYGGDYNPEQWPREVWKQDIELMKRAGVNSVSLGVFSWALLEPAEGQYTFGWLDDVVEMLAAADIGVGLATPTASPPPWFSRAYPDTLPVKPDGTPVTYGSRDAYCMSAPAYRQAARRMARELASRYGRSKALSYWHIHNEYGTLCYCDHVAAAFRAWLQRRYVSLDGVNEAWSTSFWSQRYGQWEEILPPRQTQYLHNPAQAVDFRRFVSDELLACFTEQRDEIRPLSDAPVTTNFMLPTWNHLEQWSWAGAQDIVSIDHYLDTPGPDAEAHVAYAADLTRSWAGGRSWLVMESSAADINADRVSLHKEPDRMVRHSLSYVARGARGVQFFQWRQSRGGSEMWGSALVPHSGPDSRTYRTAERLGGLLSRLDEVAAEPADGPVVRSDVAIWWHADGWWALENGGLPSVHLDYSAQVRAAHRAVWRAGLSCDFVAPGADLHAYKVLLIPAMLPVCEHSAAGVADFVRSGGRVVVWYFTGLTDHYIRAIAGGYPGAFRDVLGVRVTELHPISGSPLPLSNGWEATSWSEWIELAGAEAMVTYADGHLAGRPAITQHSYGSGVAVYVSTGLGQEHLDALVAAQCAAAGALPVVADLPAGVEAVRRYARDASYLFVINHSARPVELTGSGTELLCRAPASGTIKVPAGEVAVVRELSQHWHVHAR